MYICNSSTVSGFVHYFDPCEVCSKHFLCTDAENPCLGVSNHKLMYVCWSRVKIKVGQSSSTEFIPQINHSRSTTRSKLYAPKLSEGDREKDTSWQCESSGRLHPPKV